MQKMWAGIAWTEANNIRVIKPARTSVRGSSVPSGYTAGLPLIKLLWMLSSSLLPLHKLYYIDVPTLQEKR